MYDYVYITDISIKEELAQEINNCLNTTFLPIVQLLDHHPTALELKKYDWCKVIAEEHGEKTSGTRMFYDLLLNNGYIDNCYEPTMFEFVEMVRKYDTWLFKTKYNDNKPKQLNDLFYLYGKDRFIERIIYRIKTHDINFDEADLLLLELQQEKINKYIEDKQKEIIEKDILGYKAGVIFAEQYHSELGNTLAENNPHLDFIVIINPSKSVSYRGIKDNIDLGKDVAKVYGGGGHPMACGSPISEEFKKMIIDEYFDKE